MVLINLPHWCAKKQVSTSYRFCYFRSQIEIGESSSKREHQIDCLTHLQAQSSKLRIVGAYRPSRILHP